MLTAILLAHNAAAEDTQTVRAQIKAIAQKCRGAPADGSAKAKSYSSSVKCSNPDLTALYQHASYPYMDLLRLYTLKRLWIAERLDEKRISKAEGEREMNALATQMHRMEQQRAQKSGGGSASNVNFEDLKSLGL